MKLPNGENAIVELEKLTEYVLSPEHPRGKHKARVFAAKCGITAEHADLLRQYLLSAARDGEAAETRTDEHGRRFVIELNIAGPGGRAAVVSAWIVRMNEDFPRFVSAYVR
jgi:Domain of unknown function (DUF6883)